jgi:hypothetical protein
VTEIKPALLVPDQPRPSADTKPFFGSTSESLEMLVANYTNIKQADQVAEAVALLLSVGVMSRADITDANTDEAVWKRTFARVEAAWQQRRSASKTLLRDLQFDSLANLWSKLRINTAAGEPRVAAPYGMTAPGLFL